MGKLSGKVAVITGAASGIGAGTARRFASDGATVVLADVDETAGRAVAAEVGGTFVRCDVAVEADLEAAVAAAVQAGGHLDVFFGNAGIPGVGGPITELNPEGFDRTVAVLLKGVALGMKHACRAMRAQGTGGSIISTSSIAGLQGGWGDHVYAACKAGVIGLTRSVALEQGPFGIRVNAICPGGIVTNIFARAAEVEGAEAEELIAAVAEHMQTAQPVQRAGLPADIAAAAAYLASDDAAFITGQAIVVDGGATAARGSARSHMPEDLRRRLQGSGR